MAVIAGDAGVRVDTDEYTHFQGYHRLGFDKGLENAGAFAPLLGGHPDECPETYALFSPVNHGK